ncbi:MAG: LPS export ABC transporter permease LptF [Methylococcaceae bacterium]|nr:LPS export ABC transporter permease LptF [Methylococcaceae bacterium]
MIALDLLKTLGAVLSVIVIIIASRKFISVLKMAVSGQLAADTLLHFFSLKIIVVAISLLPVTLFMAILMVLGRMYRDQEMTALAAAGVGVGAVYRAVYMVVVPIFFIAVWLAMVSAPWAETQMKQLIHKDAESADIRGVTPGRFSEYSHGDLVVYVQGIGADKQLQGIFVQDRQHGKLAIVTAASGSMQDLANGRYIVLKGGERVQGFPGTANFITEHFDEYAVRIERQPTEVQYEQEAVNSLILWGSGRLLDLVELQRRFAIPLGIMLLAFLAVPLAKLAPRGGVYGNMLLAFLIYFSYENIRKVAHSWILSNKIPVWTGYAGVYGLLLLVGLILIVRLYGWRWFIWHPKRRQQS